MSLSVTSSRFIHVVVGVRILPFVKVHNVPFCVFTHSLVWTLPSVLPSSSAGAHPVTMGTLGCQAALARGVTAACTALSTATVTVGPGSASAGRGPQGSAAGSVNRGTFWWKATVCVSVTPPKG